MRNMHPKEAARPFRTNRTGRPGGSGAQPPLHLIHMVKVGYAEFVVLFSEHWERVEGNTAT